MAGGFSYQNQYGNAIFTNDFILAGPASDPAGVQANAGHNIAASFAAVAAAGVAGHATFISRGGTTTASGTTVEEHALWKLVNDAGLTPAGVTLCTVTAPDGGGMAPTNTGARGGTCPDGGTVVSHTPPWYVINNVSQGANVVATNACTLGTSGANTCYSLTDRATFDFLASKNSPTAGTTGIPNLKIVTAGQRRIRPGRRQRPHQLLPRLHHQPVGTG